MLRVFALVRFRINELAAETKLEVCRGPNASRKGMISGLRSTDRPVSSKLGLLVYGHLTLGEGDIIPTEYIQILR